jgi:hypothetical protein
MGFGGDASERERKGQQEIRMSAFPHAVAGGVRRRIFGLKNVGK